MRESKTKFVRDKTGNVKYVARTGYKIKEEDTLLKGKVKSYKKKIKEGKKKKRTAYIKKTGKRMRKTQKRMRDLPDPFQLFK